MDGAGFPSWAVFLLEGAFPYWVNWMLHSAVLIAAGLVVSHAVRKRGAAIQSLVLRITLLSVCLSPLVTAVVRLSAVKGATAPLPRCLVISDEAAGAPAWMKQAGVMIRPPALLARDRKEGLVPSPSLSAGAEERQSAAQRRSSRDGWLRFIAAEIVLVSTAVSCWLLINILIACRFIRRIVDSANDAGREFAAECADLAIRMGVRPPRVLFSALVRSPFVFGMFRPAVLLPSVSGDEDVVGREVLVHELAHLRRNDCFWNLLSRAATTALPFQLLLRMLARRLEETSDAVCDDYVVRHCDDPHAYARRLYHLASRFRADRYETAVGLGVVSLRSSLGRRIERILDDTRNISVKASLSTAFRAGLFFVCLTVLLGFTGMRVRTEAVRPDSARQILRSLHATVAVQPDRTAVSRALTTPKTPDSVAAERVIPSEPEGTNPSDEPDAAVSASPIADASPDAGDSNGTRDAPIVGTASPDTPSAALETESNVAVRLALLAAVSRESIDFPPAPARDEAPTVVLSNSGGLLPRPSTAAGFRTERLTGWYDEAAGNVSPVKRYHSPTREADATKDPIAALADKDACLRYGIDALRNGDLTEAEQAFLKALAFSPSDERVMNALGLTFQAKGDKSSAVKWFREAIALYPKKPDAYYNLGDLYLARGELDVAMQYQAKAISLNPALKDRSRVYY